jgi:hypothetical protein
LCVLLSIAYMVLLWICAVEPRWSALWRPLWGALWGTSVGAPCGAFWDRELGALCGVLLWTLSGGLSGALSYFGLKDIYYMLVWVFCFKGP